MLVKSNTRSKSYILYLSVSYPVKMRSLRMTTNILRRICSTLSPPVCCPPLGSYHLTSAVRHLCLRVRVSCDTRFHSRVESRRITQQMPMTSLVPQACGCRPLSCGTWPTSRLGRHGLLRFATNQRRQHQACGTLFVLFVICSLIACYRSIKDQKQITVNRQRIMCVTSAA